jgi:hypothetical protein
MQLLFGESRLRRKPHELMDQPSAFYYFTTATATTTTTITTVLTTTDTNNTASGNFNRTYIHDEIETDSITEA